MLHLIRLKAIIYDEKSEYYYYEFLMLLCRLWWVQIVGCVLAWRSYSFICTLHQLITIIVQTYLKTFNLWNACQIYFVECVSQIRHILSVIHYTISGAVCFQFTHFPCDDWESIYALSYHHHQIGSMNDCPLLRVRSWNNGARCMSLCIRQKMIHARVICVQFFSIPIYSYGISR